MVSIRLSRHGSHKNPFYRIVATEKQNKATGAPLDVIGFWYPKKKERVLDKKKFQYWVEKGARVTQAVSKLV